VAYIDSVNKNFRIFFFEQWVVSNRILTGSNELCEIETLQLKESYETWIGNIPTFSATQKKYILIVQLQ
jgi:hypothetical protein